MLRVSLLSSVVAFTMVLGRCVWRKGQRATVFTFSGVTVICLYFHLLILSKSLHIGLVIHSPPRSALA